MILPFTTEPFVTMKFLYLQVFFNLNVLPEKVDQVIINMLKQVKSKASELLDARRINASLIAEDPKDLKQGKNLPGRTSRTISSVPSSGTVSYTHLTLPTTPYV